MDNSERVRHHKSIGPDQVRAIAELAEKERMQCYKNVYRTNILWGGGAKEHPGIRHAPMPPSHNSSKDNFNKTGGFKQSR